MSAQGHHLDGRGPLILDTHELGRRPGEMRHVTLGVPAPADLGVAMMGVPEGTPLQLDLKLESVVEGVLVTGVVNTQLAGQCARCLTQITRPGHFEMTELYYYPGRDAEEDAGFVENELIDLEPAIRAAVVLDLPFSPVCRSDCAGLCPVCGANLNDHPDHRHREEIDPRWAGLTGIVDTDEHR